MLDRDEDMISSGGRHPFLGQYKVGFTGEGRIIALDVQLYNNAGYSADLSIPVSIISTITILLLQLFVIYSINTLL